MQNLKSIQPEKLSTAISWWRNWDLNTFEHRAQNQEFTLRSDAGSADFSTALDRSHCPHCQGRFGLRVPFPPFVLVSNRIELGTRICSQEYRRIARYSAKNQKRKLLVAAALTRNFNLVQELVSRETGGRRIKITPDLRLCFLRFSNEEDHERSGIENRL